MTHNISTKNKIEFYRHTQDYNTKILSLNIISSAQALKQLDAFIPVLQQQSLEELSQNAMMVQDETQHEGAEEHTTTPEDRLTFVRNLLEQYIKYDACLVHPKTNQPLGTQNKKSKTDDKKRKRTDTEEKTKEKTPKKSNKQTTPKDKTKNASKKSKTSNSDDE
ncbi:hypothetical protein AKO1_007458 [Acrasis kona]|uniref:Uncharacterized protein n=1 Tax=Acrasis kona TaxID=1008807 RepID=A0AAW2YQX7_9EUKA